MFPLSYMTKGELKDLRRIVAICLSIAFVGLATLNLPVLKKQYRSRYQKQEMPAAREAQLLSLYQAAGQKYNIPWEYLKAINKVETDFGNNTGRHHVLDVLAERQRGDFYQICAENGIDSNSASGSKAGAIGFMQFMPSTWQKYKDASGKPPYNPWDEEDSVFAAARLLAENGGRDEMNRALWNYNPDPDYVSLVTRLASDYAIDGSARTESPNPQDSQDAPSRVAMTGTGGPSEARVVDLADTPNLKSSDIKINWWFDKQVEFEKVCETIGSEHKGLMLFSILAIDKFQNRTTDFTQEDINEIRYRLREFQ
jgi:hypothetical protein